jgi:hypothetical protein
MNISWNDLNNIKETGVFPFRDGTIEITFAEISIWKTNPGAQFQLMRKHPIHGEFKYVLGKEVGEVPRPADLELIYLSTNGDSWSLTRAPTTGDRVVMHSPNRQSGGQVSFIEIDTFLAETSNGPEHQALRHLLEKKARLATILIACDIHSSKGEVYEKLVQTIRSLGSWWHHLETIWIVRSIQTPGEIRDKMQSHIGTDDQLLIIDISNDTAGWVGINDVGSKWLHENISAKAGAETFAS